MAVDLDRDQMTDEELDEERRRRLTPVGVPEGTPITTTPERAAAVRQSVPRLMPIETTSARGDDRLQPIASTTVQQPDPQNLLDRPRSSLMSFRSREDSRRQGEDLSAPAGGPQIIPEAGTSGAERVKLEQIADEKAHPWGTAENHPGRLGRVGHVLSRIGNVAGDIVMPRQMEMIPGTDLNRAEREKEATEQLGKAETRESEEQLREAEANKANRAETQKFSFHYQTPDGKTIGVRPNGDTEELPAGAQKPTMKIQAFTTMGEDGTPQNQMVIIDESKLQGLKPANGQEFTLPELQGAGAVTPLNMGKAAAKPGSAKPVYKMVPVDADHEQLNVFQDPANPTKGTPIGAVSKKGALQVWTNPNDPNAAPKLFDPAKGTLAEMPGGNAETGGALPPGAARAEIMRTNQFNTQYIKPATDIEQNFSKFQEAYKEYQNNPQTGAASMVALAQHLGSTFGSIKGTTQGEHMIAEHKDAIGLFDRMDRFVDSLKSGQQLSAEQWKDFGSLLSKTREIQWDTTAKEAERRHMPIDMVPASIKLEMFTPKGTKISVPGNRIPEAEKDGLRLVR
jgi:hypothetical protein